MLYSEFLNGINKTENKYNYAEYERINAIYNANNDMTKEDAYKLYNEPNEVIKALLEENSFLKDLNLNKEIENSKMRKTIQELKDKNASLESVRKSLQLSLYECLKESEIAAKRISNIIYG